MQSIGLRNLVWRTPGADGGRDIEGIYLSNDMSGEVIQEKWHIECKRYANSIDWPTIYEKIAYADTLRADYLLMVTTSNPSPRCESEISSWNAQRRKPLIRIWRGYQMEPILRSHLPVAVKYGLIVGSQGENVEFLPLMIELMKIAQSGYATLEFGQSVTPSLEAVAALSELLSYRMDQVRRFGKIIEGEQMSRPPLYDWLDWRGPSGCWEEAGIRAILTVYRYASGAERLVVYADRAQARLHPEGRRRAASNAEATLLTMVALWANVEVFIDSGSDVGINIRPRCSEIGKAGING